MVKGKFSVYILAQTDCSLLSVQNLKVSVIAFYPIHNIKRKALYDSADNFISLFFFVDEFTLISRADIKATVIACNTVFCIIAVFFCNFFYCYFIKFYVHFVFPCFLKNFKSLKLSISFRAIFIILSDISPS